MPYPRVQDISQCHSNWVRNFKHGFDFKKKCVYNVNYVGFADCLCHPEKSGLGLWSDCFGEQEGRKVRKSCYF